jgi:hypothetical protein
MNASAGGFLGDLPHRTKALLFAPQGTVRLRLAFRALARRHAAEVDCAEVTVAGADRLRALFGVTREPAVVFVRERAAAPLRYAGRMTWGRLARLFEEHQHHAAPRLTARNLASLCGAGAQLSIPGGDTA